LHVPFAKTEIPLQEEKQQNAEGKQKVPKNIGTTKVKM